MSFEVFLLEEAHVVGRYQRRPDFFSQRHSCVQMLFIIGALGALHFQIEPVWKDGHPLAGQHLGFFGIATDQRDANLTLFG